jgi:uncharacterized FAD-dependent dehydrogenase
VNKWLNYYDNKGREELFEVYKDAYAAKEKAELNILLSDIVERLSVPIAKRDLSIIERPYNCFVAADKDFNAACGLGHTMMVNEKFTFVNQKALDDAEDLPKMLKKDDFVIDGMRLGENIDKAVIKYGANFKTSETKDENSQKTFIENIYPKKISFQYDKTDNSGWSPPSTKTSPLLRMSP